MTIVRREHRAQFTIVPNAIFLDDRLSIVREQPRTADAHRFREIDYVVRDVPLVPTRPADTSPGPRGGKGPTEPRGRKGPAYKEYPQVPNGPAYKELDNKKGTDVPTSPSVVEGVVSSPEEERPHHRALDPARFDADIVALFDDRSEGWELLCVLPDEILTQLRERQRRRELDASALVELS